MRYKKLVSPFVLTISFFYCLFAAAETRVDLEVDHPGSKINRNIYGQFMEHLGRGIYEGVWVGEDSVISNTDGYRNDVLQALRQLKVPLLRWPGGCFADEYHWRDGVGPRDKRPKGVNTNWGGVIEPNSFGSHEFLDLAELLGAEVYVNGNLGTGSPAEMAQWLEYMTSDGDSTLANMRRTNGREKPWRIDYFAIGNESWGCGGSMSPEFYGNLYKQYATFLKTPADNSPVLIASGGYDDHTEWTEYLAGKLQPSSLPYRLEAISHHYYTLPTGEWNKKGSALGFPESEWLSTMFRTLKIDTFLKEHMAILDKYDPKEKIGFYVDEWGTWYDVSEGDPGFLYQQNSLRDAIVASVNLNIFHKYSRRVHMTNIAQMVNVLQSMILTDKEKMLLTPTYHVYRMHVPFHDAFYIPVALSGNPEYGNKEYKVPKISASAAKDADGKLWLTLTNVDPNVEERITLGRGFTSLAGELLTAKKMDAHNTFTSPAAVVPVDFHVKAKNGKLVFTLPPKSVVVVQVNP